MSTQSVRTNGVCEGDPTQGGIPDRTLTNDVTKGLKTRKNGPEVLSRCRLKGI